jgi:hypothetical protein
MNTVQNGKGERPRNNWGPKWHAGHGAIHWRHLDAAKENAVIAGQSAKPKPIWRNFAKCESSQR